ncbi:hypothetical protein L1887_54945 [Cichorium endivia]|nr:hypothetical protein L1887_54945 [Cichorium endivia]
MCTNAELPYLCDLQLFLARPLVSSHTAVAALADGQEIGDADSLGLHDSLVLGTFPREALDLETEFISSSLTNTSSSTVHDFPALKQVAERAQQKYEKSITKAAQESPPPRKGDDQARQHRADHIRTANGVEGRGARMDPRPRSPLEETAVHDVIKRPGVYGSQRRQDVRVGAIRARCSCGSGRHGQGGRQGGRRSGGARGSARQSQCFQAAGGPCLRSVFAETRPHWLRSCAAVDRRWTSRPSAPKRSRPGSAPWRAGAGDVTVDLEQADEADILAAFDTGPSSVNKGSGQGVLRAMSRIRKPSPTRMTKVDPPSVRVVQLLVRRPRPPGSYRDRTSTCRMSRRVRVTSAAIRSATRGLCIDSFVQQASAASFDLAGDDATMGTQSQRPQRHALGLEEEEVHPGRRRRRQQEDDPHRVRRASPGELQVR